MATTEERLAALEAKLAQLTATTPTTYYTHQYSGEEIDAAVGRALTGGALDTSVSNVSNQLGTFVRPNLLDNWYFGNPVNQRGQTEYTGNGYTVDRWRAWDGASSIVTIGDDGTRISGTVYQYPEVPVITAYAWKIVTLSILFADGALYTNTFTPNESGWYNAQVKSHGIDRIELIFSTNFSDVNNNFTRIVPLKVGVLSDPVLAAKLELGPTQTLAHREGDKWVLNEVPDYGEQLRRCQRYFVNFNPYKMAWFSMPPAVAVNTTQAYSAVTLPVAMRAKPVVSYGGNIVLSQSADHAVTNILVSDNTFTGNSIQLRYEVGAGTLTANSLYRVQGYYDPASYIWLSADL